MASLLTTLSAVFLPPHFICALSSSASLQFNYEMPQAKFSTKRRPLSHCWWRTSASSRIFKREIKNSSFSRPYFWQPTRALIVYRHSISVARLFLTNQHKDLYNSESKLELLRCYITKKAIKYIRQHHHDLSLVWMSGLTVIQHLNETSRVLIRRRRSLALLEET